MHRARLASKRPKALQDPPQQIAVEFGDRGRRARWRNSSSGSSIAQQKAPASTQKPDGGTGQKPAPFFLGIAREIIRARATSRAIKTRRPPPPKRKTAERFFCAKSFQVIFRAHVRKRNNTFSWPSADRPKTPKSLLCGGIIVMGGMAALAGGALYDDDE